jgi:hypothetical protein
MIKPAPISPGIDEHRGCTCVQASEQNCVKVDRHGDKDQHAIARPYSVCPQSRTQRGNSPG